MQKKSDAQFSVFGRYMSAGSLLPSQNSTFNPSPPTGPPPPSLSAGPKSHASNTTGAHGRTARAHHLRPASAADVAHNMVNAIGAFIWAVDSGKLVRTVHVTAAAEGGGASVESSVDGGARFVASRCHWYAYIAYCLLLTFHR